MSRLLHEARNALDAGWRGWPVEYVSQCTGECLSVVLTPEMITTQNRAETQPVIAYRMILTDENCQLPENRRRGKASHIARLDREFDGGASLPVGSPLLLLPLLPKLESPVAFDAMSEANR